MKILFRMLCLVLLPLAIFAKDSVEKWARYEASFQATISGNPFVGIPFKATFSNGKISKTVAGFYNGNSEFKIRFMPEEEGEWKFVTSSSHKQLNNKTGVFMCVPPTGNNKGPVKVANKYHFSYANKERYIPVGTTVYAWTHQSTALQYLTLNTLKESPFNKLRFCVFPKDYSYVKEEPELFAYHQSKKAETIQGKTKYYWDFTSFNIPFFDSLEKRIDQLDAAGIQADIILFHPYDKKRWGFDSMGYENDLVYLQYITARLASFKNVWWSMANEFDFVKYKTWQQWDDYSRFVYENDPYRHLLSIHNGLEIFDNWKPYFTHASIQNCSAVEDFGRAVLYRDAYGKPVVYDEVCYEGNLPQRWGRLSGEEMVAAFWQAAIAGTYAQHGETYRMPGDTVFWAKGGRLVGTSIPRIKFIHDLQKQSNGYWQLADVWRDHQTAQVDSSEYIIYFGKKMTNQWYFNIPKKNGPLGTAKYKAEIIDTWEMTITPVNEVFEVRSESDYRLIDINNKSIRLPDKPYLAIRLKKIK
ncbi:DUF5060 domain-containing protein [Polluticaenibacter yanchengensis]|uniref:DUF5060 domain-containing protein n=1 Tax=Polluticaenibacter yanchengensis TaxID=3014562 RepID=A0ABT4UHT2_9BACT|nr:DUF5060 domain-containing protein [Chitinophagaceae bacterium LY-5]